MPAQVSEATRQKVAKDILAGHAPGAIATMHGVSESFVSKLKKKLGAGKAPQMPDATPAPRRGRPRTAEAVSERDAVGRLLDALEPSALPALKGVELGIRAQLTELQAKLSRVQALIRLHAAPEPAQRTPDLFEHAPANGPGMDFADMADAIQPVE